MTIKDIARLCNVSVSTVSRVLNEKPDVSPEVRRCVLETIKSSNYIPNNSARDLVRTSSDAVGLVVRGVGNPFYTDVIKAIERGIDAAGYTMVMQQIGVCDDEVRSAAFMEREKKLRGVILLGGRSDYTSEELALITVPFVCCAFTNSFGNMQEDEYSSVSIADEAAACDAVKELAALGHRRIAALVSGKHDRSISELRYLGYVRALRECGIEYDDSLVVEAGSFAMRDAYTATGRLLDSGADFSAVFSIADAMAIAAMKALREHGRRIPDDCSVIAIDGLPVSEYVEPTLSTLCQPAARMGAESVDMLLSLITGRGKNRSVTLDTAFRAGGSISPAK